MTPTAKAPATGAAQPSKPRAKKPATQAKSSASAAKAPATATTVKAASTPTKAPAHPEVDAAIDALRTGARTWSHLTLGQRARLMKRLRATVTAAAEDWADASSTSKGLGPGHPLRGEEWLSGPYAALVALDTYAATLSTLAKGASPLDGVTLDETPGGRVRAHVFPTNPIDGLLLSGFTGEVWLEPGVTVDDARRGAGLGQLSPTTPGGVGLVLGAGNVSSIPVLDVLYELLASNRVALLKLNPTMDSLVGVFERALAPLIEPGFLRITTGGPEVGAYLTGHSGIDHVHITGSAATFDAIVWGTGTPAVRRRREGRPALKKPITSELGGVSPIIVVPGEWTEADLRFQAEHIATMRLTNSGHNCIAGQVVIVSSEWPQRDAFVGALRTAYAEAPERPVWYPNATPRLESAASAYPAGEWLAGHSRVFVALEEGEDAATLQATEYFAPVLGVTLLPGLGQEFVDAAVTHANDELVGTLGANVLIDPVTQKALGDGFERAIAELRYGGIAINGWTGFSFITPTLSWGAFPGSTLEDVGSGIGIVHNGLLLDRVERSVLRGPFRPFPRALGGGKFTVLPKPPWFVSSRTGAAVSEGFTRFRMDGNWLRLMGTLTKAFRA